MELEEYRKLEEENFEFIDKNNKNIIYIKDRNIIIRLSDYANYQNIKTGRQLIKVVFDRETGLSYYRPRSRDTDLSTDSSFMMTTKFEGIRKTLYENFMTVYDHGTVYDNTTVLMPDKREVLINRKNHVLKLNDEKFCVLNYKLESAGLPINDVLGPYDLKYRNEYIKLMKNGINPYYIDLYIRHKDYVLNHKGKTYRQFEIPKKHSNDMRTIKEPLERFKEIQRDMTEALVANFKLNSGKLFRGLAKNKKMNSDKSVKANFIKAKGRDSMYAYIPGRSAGKCVNDICNTMDNLGCTDSDILKLDISKFFESISWEYVKNKCQFLIGGLNENDPFVRFIKKVVVDENDQLYMGNPVSGIISNLVLLKAWSDIRLRLSYYNIQSFIYADDMTFISTDEKRTYLPTKHIIKVVNTCLRDNGLHNIKLNEKKVKYRKNNERTVLGITLKTVSGGMELGVPRCNIRNLRAAVHNLGKAEELDISDMRYIMGYYNYLYSAISNESSYKHKQRITKYIFNDTDFLVKVLGIDRINSIEDLGRVYEDNEIYLHTGLYQTISSNNELKALYDRKRVERSLLDNFFDFISTKLKVSQEKEELRRKEENRTEEDAVYAKL